MKYVLIVGAGMACTFIVGAGYENSLLASLTSGVIAIVTAMALAYVHRRDLTRDR